MIKNRITKRIAALTITVAFAFGALAPVGFAQYGTPNVAPTTLSAYAKCKKKAKTKKGKARKRALKKCKKFKGQ